MIAAFMLIIGLSGDPLADGRSRHTFSTIEECQAYQPGAMKIVADDMAKRGVQFSRMETKCLPDIGQTADDVFAQPQPQFQEPSPDATVGHPGE